MNISHLFTFCVITLSFVSCGNPVKILKREINKAGYILYQNPIEEAGSGTFIGGPPSHMMYVAHPQTCFPDDAFDGDFPMRKTDRVVLASIAKKITTEGKVNAELIEVLGAGSNPIGVGVGFDLIKTIELQFKDVTVEYLDSVVLKGYYDNGMSEVCKDFLNEVGFVIQALRVGQMRFEFTSNGGTKIELSAPVIEQILDLGIDVGWRVENRYTLVIDTPKYLGFQLGQLKEVDNGMSLFRASTVKNNKYQFKSISVFQPENKRFSQGVRKSLTRRELPDQWNINIHSNYKK
jgi:hypothetical protein